MTVSKDAEAMITARIAQIDHLVSLQLNEVLHHAELPEAGRHLARAEVPAGPERNQRQAEDQGAQRHQEGTAARPAARAGVRPERAVQEGLRRRVRRLRRRAVRGAGRRLRIRARTRGYRAAGEDLEGGGGGARSVPDRGESGDVQPGQLHGDRCAARHGEDLRHHGIRQVEELPRKRRFALRRARAAAHPDAPAVRQERRDGAKPSTTRKAWTAPTTPSTCGAMRPTLWRRG